jgi:antitoxin FitA
MAVVLTIRDVPEEVRDLLAQQARERGQSLQAFLLAVLNRQADFCRNRQLLAEISQELDSGAGVDQDAPDAAELLAHARTERGLPDTASSARPAQDVA